MVSKERSVGLPDNLQPEAGIILIDKPVGPSSFQMIRLIRRAMDIKKVGHTGTLDPFASGLLIVCIGRPATRIISQLMAGEKEYQVVIRLGIETETMDPEGAIIAERPVGRLEKKEVENCLKGFEGDILQSPPQYSALKHKGKPLYYYARKGIKVEKEARLVTIQEIQFLGIENERLSILVKCGKGTYIRSLASDIGRVLGCGAHVESLRRLRNGLFSVKEALSGDQLVEKEQAGILIRSNMLPVEKVLGNLAS